MATSPWELHHTRPLATMVPRLPTPVAPVASPVPAATGGEGSPCRYRRGICTRPRTLKANGALHSLCAVHRDRSIANQRRFDAKKRLRQGVERADDAPSKRRRPTVTLEAGYIVMAPSATALDRAGTDTDGPPRTWLLPFEVEAATALVSDAAWRRAAMAQLLRDA